MILFIQLLLLLLVRSQIFSVRCFKVGGLFFGDDAAGIMKQAAFQSAINEASEKLQRETGELLEAIVINETNTRNAYLTQHSVCKMLQEGVIAVFGPQESESSPIVQSVCDSKEIPHIQTRYQTDQYRGSCLINLHPHPKALSKAYSDLIKEWQWKSFVIVYENNESLIRISDLLKPHNNGGALIKLQQLNTTYDDHRRMLREIRDSGETNILLDCSIRNLKIALEQAQQVGLIVAKYNYIVTCLDLHTLDLEQYKYSGANITGFRLVDLSNNELAKHVEQWDLDITADKVLVETALLHDAVILFEQAVSFLAANNSNFQDKSLMCDSIDSWNLGFSIINYMKLTEMPNGFTGLVKFDHEGFRSDIELEIIELVEDGMQRAGVWNMTDGVEITKIFKSTPKEHAKVTDLKNVTFNVIIPMTPPFGMRKKISVTLSGNEQYEGYGVDLIQELSFISGFKYNFIIQEDGNIGKPVVILPNGYRKWNGMIGAVLDGRADLAIGDITITANRMQDVDFSYQFMDLGIAILYEEPKKAPPDLFSFLFPISTEVWLLVITAYIGVSLLFFIMARLSPYEWRNPYPCVQEPEVLENQFSLSNAFWFTIGALMQQGSDIAPISTSTRMAAGIWWFFTLIMVSSYTANLAAFLVVENPTSPFHNARELGNQEEIDYGCKKDGATFQFFQNSTDEIYKKMYDRMVDNPELLVGTNAEGVKRVLNSEGKYAFLMESTSIEYEKERHCELDQIGDTLDNKNYGIAMRKNSWYHDAIDRSMLILQERGKLADMKRKWWKEKYAENCLSDKKNDAETLKLANVGGVFVVLIGGTMVAFIVMIIELLVHSWTETQNENVSLRQKLVQELKFVIQCKTIKPVYTDKASLLGDANGNDLQERPVPGWVVD